MDLSNAPRRRETLAPAAASSRTSSTSLSDTYTVPWRDGFRLGCGVDAITGVVAQTAVKDFPFDGKNPAQRKAEFLYLCRDVASVQDAFSDSDQARGTLNLAPLKLDVEHSATELKKVSHSSTTFSLVMRSYAIFDNETSTADRYELRPSAVDVLAQKGVEAFRDQFGDFFVARYTLRSQFSAVMKFTCANSVQRTSLAQRLGLKVNFADSAHAEGRAELRSELAALSDVTTESVTISLDIIMSGVSGDTSKRSQAHWDLEDGLKNTSIVLQRLDWFQKNLQPLYYTAELRAYHVVTVKNDKAPKIPKSISRPPSVFSELAHIKTLIQRCTVSAAAFAAFSGDCPTLKASMDEFNSLVGDCILEQPELARDDDRRCHFKDALDRVKSRFEHYATVLSVWSFLLVEGTKESGPYSASRAGETWTYGQVQSQSTVELTTQPVQLIPTKGGPKFFSKRTLDKANLVLVRQSSLPNVADAHGQERVSGCIITSIHGKGGWEVSKDRDLLLSPVQQPGAMFTMWGGSPWSKDEWKIVLYIIRDPFLDELMQSNLSQHMPSRNRLH